MSQIADVKRKVADHYKGVDWDPVVRRTWVEAYLNSLYFKKRGAELEDAWEDIFALVVYMDRTNHTSLSEIPWWEYSMALEWVEGHVWSERFELTLPNVKRVLSRWRELYTFLAETGTDVDMTEIDKAITHICGRGKLKLVKNIPYTGDEGWMELSKPGSSEPVGFTMADFWLLIAYRAHGESWDKLEEELKGVPSVREKKKRLQQLRDRLQRLGYTDNASNLILGQVTQDDVETAEHWFYRKRIAQKSGS